MNAVSNVRSMRAVEPSPLASAIIQAALTSDHVGICLNNGGTEAEINAAEDAAWDAKQALIAEFRALGVTPDWAKRIGGVL